MGPISKKVIAGLINITSPFFRGALKKASKDWASVCWGFPDPTLGSHKAIIRIHDNHNLVLPVSFMPPSSLKVCPKAIVIYANPVEIKLNFLIPKVFPALEFFLTATG